MDWTWTMDRFFVDKNNINLEENTCIIEGEDVKHITKVLVVESLEENGFEIVEVIRKGEWSAIVSKIKK